MEKVPIINGPCQSGKFTLARMLFSKHDYLNYYDSEKSFYKTTFSKYSKNPISQNFKERTKPFLTNIKHVKASHWLLTMDINNANSLKNGKIMLIRSKDFEDFLKSTFESLKIKAFFICI